MREGLFSSPVAASATVAACVEKFVEILRSSDLVSRRVPDVGRAGISLDHPIPTRIGLVVLAGAYVTKSCPIFDWFAPSAENYRRAAQRQ